MSIYKIKYTDKNESKQAKEVEAANDMWAEDVAYTLADKGNYKVYRKVMAPETTAGFYWEFAFDSDTWQNKKFKQVNGNYIIK